MVVVVDTSVWVDVFRDSRGGRSRKLKKACAGADVVLTRFTQLELLEGSADEHEWNLLADYLRGQDYLEASEETWPSAARIFFELRRRGLTVRSPIDCCIAQLALEHRALLLHRDRDFETIARIRPLSHRFLTW